MNGVSIIIVKLFVEEDHQPKPIVEHDMNCVLPKLSSADLHVRGEVTPVQQGRDEFSVLAMHDSSVIGPACISYIMSLYEKIDNIVGQSQFL